jgi:hypothetical protein
MCLARTCNQMIFRQERKVRSFADWVGLFICLCFSICLALCSQTASAQTESPKTTIVGIKLMKSERGAVSSNANIAAPSDCHQCAVLHGPFYEGQNAWEIFFYLRVPVSEKTIHHVQVESGGIAVRAVIVEKDSIPFSQHGNTIEFDLPVAPRERSSTLELQTNLEWPGLTVRIEHAFEDRRAGTYARGTWPATERQAALNLEFGLREAIRILGLDQQVYTQGRGTIHLMGFDTNYPLGHEDSPPHIHIILRWPHFAGSQAPHFYLTSGGLLRGTTVTVDGLPALGKINVPDGTAFPAVDYLGQEVYQTTVEPNGTLLVARSGEKKAACRLSPAETTVKNGFATGVSVHCDGAADVHVRALDNTDRGELQVWVNSNAPELYLYNPDTAVLISSTPALPKFAPEGGK